jgi:hypothetical protein
VEFFKSFDQNSSGQPYYATIQELDEHGILENFFQDSIRILQEILKNISIRKLDQFGILVKFSQDLIRIIFKN